MTTNYPTTLDTTSTLPAESASTPLSTNHVTAHTNMRDAIIAIQTLMGITASAVSGTINFILGEITGTDKAVGKTAIQIIQNKTLGSGTKIVLGSDGVGDIWYAGASNVLTRLAIGTNNYILKIVAGVPAWVAETVTVAMTTTVAGIAKIATSAQITLGTANDGAGTPYVVTPDQLLGSQVNQKGFFGDGSDGDVVISGTTTLTADMNYNNLTINSSQILNTGGYRIFVRGTLTNNGTIRNNGGNASGSTGGIPAPAGTLLGGGAGANSGGLTGGNAGGGGAGIVMIFARNVAVQGTIEAKGGDGAQPSGASSNTAGSNGGSVTRGLIQTGHGGAGGNTGSNSGGIGGVITTSSKMSRGNLTMLTMMIDGIIQLGGGGGGASGGENGAGPNSGGGGGGQGGLIVFVYDNIVTTGTTTVTGGLGKAGFGTGGLSGSNGDAGLVISIKL